MKFFENLFDPFAPASGPPPKTLIAFGKWLFAGAEKAVLMMGVVSVLIGVAEVVAAWLVGLIIERFLFLAAAPFLMATPCRWSAWWRLCCCCGPRLFCFRRGLIRFHLGRGFRCLGYFGCINTRLGKASAFLRMILPAG